MLAGARWERVDIKQTRGSEGELGQQFCAAQPGSDPSGSTVYSARVRDCSIGKFWVAAIWLVACTHQARVAPAAPAQAPSPARTVEAPLLNAPVEKHAGATSESRLFDAFIQCGRHDLGVLDGRWVSTEPKPRDVWLCEGHIRWMSDVPLVSDVCLSEIRPVRGGLDAEGTWHEDWHDPGDAAGLSLRLRGDDQNLSIEVADWENDKEWARFFQLRRAPAAGAGPNMACPLK